MLERLRVQGFRSIADLDVALTPLVVLFGPNAAGKTNVLESLLLLSRLVTEPTLADALRPPLRGYPHEAFMLPHGGLAELLGQEEARLALEADIACGSSGALRYRIEIGIDPRAGALNLVDESLVRLDRDRQPKGQPRIEKEDDHFVLRRAKKRGRPFRESVSHYSLASNRQHSGEDFPELDALRTELSGWRMYYLDPREKMREPQPPQEVRDIGPRGEMLAPFLRRLKMGKDTRPHFDAIRRALRNAIPSIESLDVDLDEKHGTLDVAIRQEGTVYSSRVISEGTLRVLGLCCIAVNPWPVRLVAFEEPENGIHPRRLDVVADLLDRAARGERQVIVSTHSPALVAHFARKMKKEPERITLLRCYLEDRETGLSRFAPLGELTMDQEIREALLDSEEERVLQEMMLRGWLDAR